MEQELAAMLKSQGEREFTQMVAMVEQHDWEGVCTGLSEMRVLTNGLTTILRDVLGPLGEAQGFAKAIIGIAASIVETVILVKVNNYRSQLLARRLGDMKPAIELLVKNLKNKADALMKMPMSTLNGGPQFLQMWPASCFELFSSPSLSKTRKSCSKRTDCSCEQEFERDSTA